VLYKEQILQNNKIGFMAKTIMWTNLFHVMISFSKVIYFLNFHLTTVAALCPWFLSSRMFPYHKIKWWRGQKYGDEPPPALRTDPDAPPTLLAIDATVPANNPTQQASSTMTPAPETDNAPMCENM